MKATVIGILDILDATQCIKDSPLLSQDQRSTMLTELLTEMPLEMFCHQCSKSRTIVTEIIEREINGNQAPKTKSKITPKASKRTTQSPKKELLLDSDGHSRGKSKAAGVVN
tara:strand:+ start:443 stop:778 length:336 start_codon:yes stop_codon:yes gene_type:complete